MYIHVNIIESHHNVIYISVPKATDHEYIFQTIIPKPVHVSSEVWCGLVAVRTRIYSWRLTSRVTRLTTFVWDATHSG